MVDPPYLVTLLENNICAGIEAAACIWGDTVISIRLGFISNFTMKWSAIIHKWIETVILIKYFVTFGEN